MGEPKAFNLPPLDSVELCPKCLRKDGNGHVRYRDAKYCEATSGFPEHIKRTCHKCGYWWHEACAVARVEAEG